MKLRTFMMEKRRGIEPEIEVRSMGKGVVIVSGLDLTSGLLGTKHVGDRRVSAELGSGVFEEGGGVGGDPVAVINACCRDPGRERTCAGGGI